MTIHAAIIEESDRLTRIEELLKLADHPLSAQEIAMAAYPNSNPPKIMLNVSTYIGEMRGQINRNNGHIVSFSTKWKAADPGKPLGRRDNDDGSVTFLIERATHLWHDGRPRYYLISAPGWSPRWIVNTAGEVIRTNGHQPAPAPVQSAPLAAPSNLVCALARCGRPVPLDRQREGSEYCCQAHADEAIKKIRETTNAAIAAKQGDLF